MNTEIENLIENRPKRTWRYALFRIGRFLVFAYVAILVFLVLAETKLVYPGSKYPHGNWQPTEFAFEEVEFQCLKPQKQVIPARHLPLLEQ